MTQKKAKVSFRLRIANLYYGDGETTDQIIQQLARWKGHLTTEHIVEEFILEPILVTHELSNYKSVKCHRNWNKVFDKRVRRDSAIKKHIESVNKYTGNPDDYQEQVRKNFQTKLNDKQIKVFYKSCFRYVVVFAQIQIQAINNMRRAKTRIYAPIIKDLGCCSVYTDTFNDIIELVKGVPKSWKTIKCIDITVIATHFPCLGVLLSEELN